MVDVGLYAPHSPSTASTATTTAATRAAAVAPFMSGNTLAQAAGAALVAILGH